MSEKENLDFEFLSRQCRTHTHGNCGEEWSGLGIKVRCYCGCHGREHKAMNSDYSESRFHQKIRVTCNTTKKIQNQEQAGLVPEQEEQHCTLLKTWTSEAFSIKNSESLNNKHSGFGFDGPKDIERKFYSQRANRKSSFLGVAMVNGR